jgi:hypothetical protein
MARPAASASASTFDTQLQLLAWLHWLWAGFNAVIGIATAAFAIAAMLAATVGPGLPDPGIAAAVTSGAFFLVSITALIWSAAHAGCARALQRRDPLGRLAALGLALFDAALVPLGTLLAGYTAWLLLQDAGRRRFGVV